MMNKEGKGKIKDQDKVKIRALNNINAKLNIIQRLNADGTLKKDADDK